MSLQPLPVLKPGDKVEILAPASRCSDQQLRQMKDLLISWELDCVVQEEIFGQDLLCAHTDEHRLRHLKNALDHPEIKAIFCARGGYGSLRLIPGLAQVPKPKVPKILIGMSDITALHLYLLQKWQWPTIHGAAAPDRFSAESIASLKALLFNPEQQSGGFELKALNQQALEPKLLKTTLTGGNLSIIQAGIGTSWQLDAQDKILLIEEIGERAYRVDRMLEQLVQADIVQGSAAILFADFLKAEEPDGSSLIDEVLQRFADSFAKPVLRLKGIGHGPDNTPVPLGTPVCLQLGQTLQLTCFRGYTLNRS